MINDPAVYTLFIECHRRFQYAEGLLLYKINPMNGTPIGGVAGTKDVGGYMRVEIGSKAYMTHRLIFLMLRGEWPDEVDHINNARSDSRIENLRAATRNQNQHNRAAQANNTSGFKGVGYVSRDRKWRARCTINKHQYLLGYFDTAQEADEVACLAREILHGEFVNHKPANARVPRIKP